MKNKKKIAIPIFLILAFLILYIIFSVTPTRTEIQFLPLWTLYVSSDVVTGEEQLIPESHLVPFKLSDNIGYFDTQGNLVYKYNISQRFTISDNYFILYSNDSTSFNVQKQNGEVVLKKSFAGFPYLFEDKLFVFSPGGNTVSQFDLEGNLKFQYQSYAPLLSFSQGKDCSVLGFADGELCTIFPESDIKISTYPGGSDYQIIYGSDISDSGDLIACVCGYDKQRFVLYKRTGSQQKPIFHEYIEEQTTEPVEVFFTSDSKYAYYSSKNMLGIVDCTKLKSNHFSLDSKVLKITEIPDLNIVFVLSKSDENYKITMIEKASAVVGEYSFDAKEAFINSYENLLFVGADDEISCLEIVRN